MRPTVESTNVPWKPADPSATLSPRAGAPVDEKAPTPHEVFFEAGIVLVAALALCAGVDLLLTLLGVPQP